MSQSYDVSSSLPFNYSDTFVYDEMLTAENFGPDAQVHLGLPTAGGPGPDALELILSHNPDFEEYLEKTNRVPYMVPDYSIGIMYEENMEPFVDNFWVVMSKPKDVPGSFDLDEALSKIPKPAGVA